MRICFALLCLLCFSAFASEPYVVSVKHDTELRTYAAQPRLSDVLEFTKDAVWYWPSVALFADDREVQYQQQRLLNRLNELHFYWLQQKKQHYADTISGLIGQIKTWQVAKRIDLDVNFQLVRFRQEINLRLDHGDYILQLSETRPDTVLLQGAIVAAGERQYQNTAMAKQYLLSEKRLAGAERSWVYIIQPTGKIVKTGIAYWNGQQHQPAPGAIIFLPLQNKLLPEPWQHLNEEILAVAVNRMLP